MPHGVQGIKFIEQICSLSCQFTVALGLSCYPHKFDFSVIYSAELSFTEILVFLHSQLFTAMELPFSYSCLTLQTWWYWHVSYGSG